MRLTEKQKRYKEAIDWLINPIYRAEGRTTLLAYCFIDLAIQNRGQWIPIFDHIPLERCKREVLIPTIQRMIQIGFPMLEENLEINSSGFRIQHSNKTYITTDGKIKGGQNEKV